MAAKKADIRQALTANLLRDGLVVFMTDGAAWSPWIEDAAIVASKEAALELEGKGTIAAKANVVVGPYLIEVIEENGRPRAASSHNISSPQRARRPRQIRQQLQVIERCIFLFVVPQALGQLLFIN